MEIAIDHYEQALTVYNSTEHPTDWASIQSDLGNIYETRLEGDRAQNIEKAIDHYQQALTVRTPENFPQEWLWTQTALSSACLHRIWGNKSSNIEKALKYGQDALDRWSQVDLPEELPRVYICLADAYKARVEGERWQNIEAAIKHYKEAIAETRREDFQFKWAAYQNSLASCYIERLKGERTENIREAIKRYKLAIEATPRPDAPSMWAKYQWNLGNAYASLLKEEEKAEYIKKALKRYHNALKVYERNVFLFEYRSVQRSLGDLYFLLRNWLEALRFYKETIEAGELMFAEAHTEIGRRAEMGEPAYINAAFCALHLDQFNDAWWFLEQGRTRLLTEALNLDEAEIAQLPEKWREPLQDKRKQVRTLEAEMRFPETTPAQRSRIELAEVLKQKRAELEDIVRQIRVDYSEFMARGIGLDELFEQIPVGGALVAPIITTEGSAALIIPHGVTDIGKTHVVWLPDLKQKNLWAIFWNEIGWLKAYPRHDNDKEKTDSHVDANKEEDVQASHKARKDSRENWYQVIEKTTQQLWNLLMQPIYERLRALRIEEGASIFIMPQLGLGLLPLQAAWREVGGQTRMFLDDYTVSYMLSGYVLRTCQRRLRQQEQAQNSLLAVVNPTSDLAYAAYEGAQVISYFDSAKNLLTGPEATKDAVMRGMAECNYLHFACHGSHDWYNVMVSGLQLAGAENVKESQLQLYEIISPQLNLAVSRLVVLSACETGLIDIEQPPDEFVGLPAGFLQAGATGVMSTLWPVDDISTALLMERFYGYHLEDGMEPGRALRQAQIWLRDVTAGELATHFGKKRQEQMEMYEHMSASWRHFVTMEPDEKPFAHPYYWAAFTFTGV
jgi:CHAT domain-containing protein